MSGPEIRWPVRPRAERPPAAVPINDRPRRSSARGTGGRACVEEGRPAGERPSAKMTLNGWIADGHHE